MVYTTWGQMDDLTYTLIILRALMESMKFSSFFFFFKQFYTFDELNQLLPCDHVLSLKGSPCSQQVVLKNQMTTAKLDMKLGTVSI